MKYILTLLIIICFGFKINAQIEYKTTKLRIELPTIQTELCKAKIETYLGKQYGLSEVEVNVRKKYLKLMYFATRVQPNQIKQMITGLGYQADSLQPDPEAYNRLPAECKIPGLLFKEIPKPIEIKPTTPSEPVIKLTKREEFLKAKKEQDEANAKKVALNAQKLDTVIVKPIVNPVIKKEISKPLPSKKAVIKKPVKKS